jgi:hypothetical protein
MRVSWTASYNRRMQVQFLLLVLAALASGVGVAHAARPFMTDDARLTTEGSCQLESWTRRYTDRVEYWALPACNPTGNLEITAGGGHFNVDGQPSSNDHILQAKTLFRPMQTNDWGWGLAVGRAWHPSAQSGPNNMGNTYVYVPLSVSMRDDRVVFHANLGWVKDQQSRLHSTTWGGGVEYWLHPKVMLIAEAFGDDRQKPFVQSGLRFSVVPGLFQLDFTRGTQPGGPGRSAWTSFGLRYTPDKLF